MIVLACVFIEKIVTLTHMPHKFVLHFLQCTKPRTLAVSRGIYGGVTSAWGWFGIAGISSSRRRLAEVLLAVNPVF